MKTIKHMPLYMVGAGVAIMLPSAFAEGFLDDSKASLQLRNFYMNRDFREGRGPSQREEWGQGFILRYESGYTPGTLGVGFDAIGMLGIKLDSGRGRAGTGLLPVEDDGDVTDDYSKAGGTLKLRASNSELKVGTLMPKWPTLQANNGRLLPQTFEGMQLQVRELKGLELTGAQIQRAVQRDQTSDEGLTLNNKNRRFSGSLDGGDFDLLGFTYRLQGSTDFTYQYARFENIYRQQFMGISDRRQGEWGAFNSDVRFFLSDDEGNARGGNIDNRVFSAMGTYKLNGHSLGVGYQVMSGDSAFPYVSGADPFLVNFVQVGDFAEKDEQSWQLRYDYDLAKVGIPGLTFMTRYLRGSGADVPGADSGGERELDVELQYVFQSGSVKGLGVRLRSATYRSDFARDANDARVIISYPLSLL
ncbi:OprD family porin [Pseudomonas fluorescens]|uniref:OprD family porin n=2 Tax=Pseudomonas fluorescens TaxID=294 RepID=A0A944DLG1_PSEFL|nr:OprD family porin [Pseudomonas fluorescens]MBT2308991.1 OprD family porin [Pseudomonas fluorescens]MBT2312256.1 OprD family porin [Pseudomonas fluorescens]MBT2318177.1 OprD family porin [Pseudomonas fluorescens]MBT2332012.1 OprD family porin [Pseudomonas fluorescens]